MGHCPDCALRILKKSSRKYGTHSGFLPIFVAAGARKIDAAVACACHPWWHCFSEELKMGLLDEVIGAALGARGQPAPAQTAQGRAAPDQFSQIAAALTALLAPRPTSAGAGQAGAAPAQAAPGGLDVLVNQFRQSGLEDVINSWIGTGQNQAISPNELRDALGQKTVNDLS